VHGDGRTGKAGPVVDHRRVPLVPVIYRIVLIQGDGGEPLD